MDDSIAELQSLEREMAEQTARIDLESFCLPVRDAAGLWFDLDSAEGEAERAARYGELRGILHRHPHNPRLVRFPEEGES